MILLVVVVFAVVVSVAVVSLVVVVFAGAVVVVVTVVVGSRAAVKMVLVVGSVVVVAAVAAEVTESVVDDVAEIVPALAVEVYHKSCWCSEHWLVTVEGSLLMVAGRQLVKAFDVKSSPELVSAAELTLAGIASFVTSFHASA